MDTRTREPHRACTENHKVARVRAYGGHSMPTRVARVCAYGGHGLRVARVRAYGGHSLPTRVARVRAYGGHGFHKGSPACVRTAARGNNNEWVPYLLCAPGSTTAGGRRMRLDSDM